MINNPASIVISNWWQSLILPGYIVAIEIESLQDLQQIVEDDLATLSLCQFVQICGQNQHVLLELGAHLVQLL